MTGDYGFSDYFCSREHLIDDYWLVEILKQFIQQAHAMKSAAILMLACLASLVAGADKSLFKTCQQSSFCRRCRYTNETFSYEALADSLLTGAYYLTVDIRNKVNGHLFVLRLEAFKVIAIQFNNN